MKVYIIAGEDYDEQEYFGVASSEQRCIQFAMDAYRSEIRRLERWIEETKEQLMLPLEKRNKTLDYHRSKERRWEGWAKAPDYFLEEDIEQQRERISAYEQAIATNDWKGDTLSENLKLEYYKYYEFELDEIKQPKRD